MPETNIDKLRTAKEKIAQVYKDEALDEVFDNSLLLILHNSIENIENAIKDLAKRPLT